MGAILRGCNPTVTVLFYCKNKDDNIQIKFNKIEVHIFANI